VSEANPVVDASAVLALLTGEPFDRSDPQNLANASISAVNLSEVWARLLDIGMPETAIDAAVAKLDLQVVPFDERQARAAARLRSHTRQLGLSLGDRACLALGLALGRPVVTADRVWRDLELGLDIVLIR
jgi:PIN domain nuclease of toxin-antitoxin system